MNRQPSKSQLMRQPSALTVTSTGSPVPSNLSIATGGDESPQVEKPTIPMPASRRESAINRRKSQQNERVKRRITRINPNITIQDITRPTRTAIPEKKLQPNRSAVFHFHCEGDLKVDEIKGTTTHIEWSATFDKPIEQLIYPSLQRFDLEGFEEKLKAKNQLHGHTQPSTHSNLLHIHNLSSQNKGLTVLTESKPIIANDGVTIDFLPNIDKINPQIMFLHTPKWNGKVTVKSNNNSPLKESQASFGDENSIGDDQEQSNFSPNKDHNEQNDNRSSLSPPSRKTRSKTKRGGKDFPDDGSEYSQQTLSTTSNVPQTLDFTLNHQTFMEAVESVGEKYLREKIREKYEIRQEITRKEKHDELLASSPFHIEKVANALNSSKGRFPNLQPPKLDPGDELYSTLLARTSAINQGVQQALTKLTDLSPEEQAYGEQAKFIRSTTPMTAQYLQNGVLYYRVSSIHNSNVQCG